MMQELQRITGTKLQAARDTINGLTRTYLRDLNVDEYTEMLVNKYRVNTPTLNIEQTKTNLKSEKLTPHQMPGGTSFSFGQMFDVDIAEYTVPFFIPDSLSSYMTGYAGAQIIAKHAKGNTLVFPYTNYKKITDGDVEEFKASFQRDINYVKEYFEVLEKAVAEINSQLEQSIRGYVEQTVKKAKDEDGLEKKLNPFL